ncbi:MAG: Succinyl-CoA ligase [ADP-forming] subunit beta [Chromatiales bacterium USCg_Taylor]|nr:MAG: Succinyl-CoA ligase [ADP-forming] subunit beta [Chromatiales bacterium USCg_Taylor]
MNLHEYQAKKLFEEYGIAVPPGKPAHSIKEALRHAAESHGPWVIKAQVHAGGRGKAGGVKFADSIEKVESIVRDMLGMQLITKQSAPTGQPVNCVLVQRASNFVAEIYLAMVVDRRTKRLAVIASRAGGMDIEEVAATEPEKILSLTIDPILGLQSFQSRRVAQALALDATQNKQLSAILAAMFRLFLEKDLSLIEINPLIITDTGELQALDAKISIDDNALYRQAALAEWRDPTQEDPKENVARRYDLNYVSLDGNIGCMVNGAGLAMATMDVITLHGGQPANFLDVGGNTNADKVAEAFKLLVSDTKVKAILVNIFGGIVRCDLIAEGIIQAVREVGVNVPVVVRLEGTNVDRGRKILAETAFSITAAEDLGDAARKAVAAVGGA